MGLGVGREMIEPFKNFFSLGLEFRIGLGFFCHLTFLINVWDKFITAQRAHVW